MSENDDTTNTLLWDHDIISRYIATVTTEYEPARNTVKLEWTEKRDDG